MQGKYPPTEKDGIGWRTRGPTAEREGDGGDGGDGDGEPDKYAYVYVYIIESAGFWFVGVVSLGFAGFIGNPWNPWDPRRVLTIKYKKD